MLQTTLRYPDVRFAERQTEMIGTLVQIEIMPPPNNHRGGRLQLLSLEMPTAFGSICSEFFLFECLNSPPGFTNRHNGNQPNRCHRSTVDPDYEAGTRDVGVRGRLWKSESVQKAMDEEEDRVCELLPRLHTPPVKPSLYSGEKVEGKLGVLSSVF